MSTKTSHDIIESLQKWILQQLLGQGEEGLLPTEKLFTNTLEFRDSKIEESYVKWIYESYYQHERYIQLMIAFIPFIYGLTYFLDPLLDDIAFIPCAIAPTIPVLGYFLSGYWRWLRDPIRFHHLIPIMIIIEVLAVQWGPERIFYLRLMAVNSGVMQFASPYFVAAIYGLMIASNAPLKHRIIYATILTVALIPSYWTVYRDPALLGATVGTVMYCTTLFSAIISGYHRDISSRRFYYVKYKKNSVMLKTTLVPDSKQTNENIASIKSERSHFHLHFMHKYITVKASDSEMEAKYQRYNTRRSYLVIRQILPAFIISNGWTLYTLYFRPQIYRDYLPQGTIRVYGVTGIMTLYFIVSVCLRFDKLPEWVQKRTSGIVSCFIAINLLYMQLVYQIMTKQVMDGGYTYFMNEMASEYIGFLCSTTVAVGVPNTHLFSFFGISAVLTIVIVLFINASGLMFTFLLFSMIPWMLYVNRKMEIERRNHVLGA